MGTARHLLPFINPVELVRAWRFGRGAEAWQKTTRDLELHLYSRMLASGMLHYGFFDDPAIEPEAISIALLELAQKRYAENVIAGIDGRGGAVLDVGCGLGGLAELIHSRGLEVEVLTPDRNQIEFIKANLGFLKSHHCRYEDFEPGRDYGTVINAESLQYIDLRRAFMKSGAVVGRGGSWVVSDYFRVEGRRAGRKGAHLLTDFRELIEEHGWVIALERDITVNVLPTLKFVHMYVERFLDPIRHYGQEKLRLKRPALYYLTRGLRESLDRKVRREMAAIDPGLFLQQKRYMHFVLNKD